MQRKWKKSDKIAQTYKKHSKIEKIKKMKTFLSKPLDF